MQRHSSLLISGMALALFTACSNTTPTNPSQSTAPTKSNNGASLNKADYPVFPKVDADADPSVPAEQGGKGFTGQGWETNADFDFIGDPRAVKGGGYREEQLDFPGTLRIDGPEANTQLNSMIAAMMYETLLSLHPTTMQYIPALATHWQVSPDKMTFKFRLNPNAKFSDGTPVNADDVVKSFDFFMDKTLQAPMTATVYSKFERPVAESKYIVSVKSKVLNWRNFLYFAANLFILPSSVLKNVNGETYLKDYNFKFLPGTGPYIVKEEDIDKGKSVTIRRRADYWAEKARANVGLNNFDEVKEIIVRDPNLALEMFKKGDLDFYYVFRSKQWVEDLNFETAQRGLVQKVKVFNNKPAGTQGLAFNTRREPWNDIRVRKAIAMLFNREGMVAKLMYGQYMPLNSHFAGSVYENPSNPKTPFDPEGAVKLLADAGWRTRDAQGRLVKDGKPFSFEVLYSQKSSEAYLTVFQEDLRKIGITLNLRLVTAETRFKQVMDRKFDAVDQAWTGLTFPNPETQFSSELADIPNNNNITGFKNKRVDEIMKAYDSMFDVNERIKAMQELDGIVSNDYQYAFAWYPPYERLLFWNKFGQPKGMLTRTGDYTTIPTLWWIDPEKAAQVAKGLTDNSVKVAILPEEDKYWLSFGKNEDLLKAEPAKKP